MIGGIGFAIVILMVFGGYIAAGGKIEIVLQALPFELAIIGGASIGAFLISNDSKVITSTLKSLKKTFTGSKWNNDDYQDLLCLLFELIKLSRGNPITLEEHIENPDESSIFQRYKKIYHDKNAVEIICDTLRAAGMNYDDPHQVEEVLTKRIEHQKTEDLHVSHALQSMADGLPALGIVAAVLGVIKTMASIDQPPEILGKMIGGALVGTFLGVFLSYGFVSPISNRLKDITEEETNFYLLIREVLVANMHRHPANLCIEVGRQYTPQKLRPSYSDLETALRSIKI